MEAIVKLSAILLLINFAHAEIFTYEFGVDGGSVIYSKEGSIPLLNYNTRISVPNPDNVRITYVKVTVDALAPPKVDFDAGTKQVSIYYTWLQVSASRYTIVVKGTKIH